MALFKNAYDSHAHSMEILNQIYGYDSFLDSITTIADMGCGAGLDTQWWATLETRDDPPEPRNFLVYAVDKDVSKIEHEVQILPNVKILQGDFEDRIIPRNVDIIWAHDVLQYAKNPLKCLANWKNTLNINGMLLLAVPQTTYLENNRLKIDTHSYQYFNYNILNLMYMLAVSGFDCNDAYFYRKENSPWLYAGVYATENKPMSADTSWYDLMDRGLINDFVANGIRKYGYARLEDVVVRWFDRNLYQVTN